MKKSDNQLKDVFKNFAVVLYFAYVCQLKIYQPSKILTVEILSRTTTYNPENH